MKLVGLVRLNRTKAKLTHSINGNDIGFSLIKAFHLWDFPFPREFLKIKFFTCFARYPGPVSDKSKDWREKHYISEFSTSVKKMR